MREPSTIPPVHPGKIPVATVLVLSAVVIALAVYANLSFVVVEKEDYRFFPPFKVGFNANQNYVLGGEYYQIAQSIAAGEGFASPFKERTGPTAWMPPLLPGIMVGLHWACAGNRYAVMTVMIVLQNCTLIATGLLILALVRRTAGRIGAWSATAIFVAALLCDFMLCFQYSHDSWLVLLALDLLIAGLCWQRPLQRRQTAAVWGVFGGLCALINPIVGFAWGILSLIGAGQHRAWSALVIAVLMAGLTLTPWTVRNYLVFGRLIPVKSNLAYELYQSQCLQPDGLIQSTTFGSHPFAVAGKERQEYKTQGETAFLDRKAERFWNSVQANPAAFVKRVGDRLLGAILWYQPYDRREAIERPWVFWTERLLFPLPFLSLLLLILLDFRQPLHAVQWIVIGVYVLYLIPYIAISYYERYAMPLIGAKVLLVLWGVDRLVGVPR